MTATGARWLGNPAPPSCRAGHALGLPRILRGSAFGCGPVIGVRTQHLFRNLDRDRAKFDVMEACEAGAGRSAKSICLIRPIRFHIVPCFGEALALSLHWITLEIRIVQAN